MNFLESSIADGMIARVLKDTTSPPPPDHMLSCKRSKDMPLVTTFFTVVLEQEVGLIH